MIFSKKEKIRSPYTLEICGSCNKQSQRKFLQGDYVFKKTSSCKFCEGQLIIEKIFGKITTS